MLKADFRLQKAFGAVSVLWISSLVSAGLAFLTQVVLARELTPAGYGMFAAALATVTLQVKVFDLSGKEVWDSGVVSGDAIDWDRNNDFGERLAYGAYIYSAQGWNSSGDSIFQKNGKLALMPGDKVQLQAAPVAISESQGTVLPDASDYRVETQAVYSGDGIFTSTGANTTVAAIADTSHVGQLKAVGGLRSEFYFYDSGAPADRKRAVIRSDDGSYSFVRTNDAWTQEYNLVTFQYNGNVGIGTTSPTARLEVESSTGQDLIAAYPSSSRVAGSAVFVVKSIGEVRADGAYYGANFITRSGAADVAERINTSEWVEAGYVVEIDPEHPGFFRKASSPYSTKVAGIISTSPGVILGNSYDKATDDWEDNRPVLAVTGRVPCKVSAENGAIEIGDLLVASSTPGVAMKGNPEESMGAVVGKAMEPLEDVEGTIVVQVMLR